MCCARQRRFRVCCVLSCGGGSRDWVGALARRCCGAIGEVLTCTLALAYILTCRVFCAFVGVGVLNVSC